MRHLLLAAFAFPAPALAQDFHCRNTDAEIRCAQGKCTVETQDFTPMELTRRGDTLTICAYSGCWHAPIRMRRTEGGVAFLYAEAHGALAVMFDRRARVAQMRWGGFANAMACD